MKNNIGNIIYNIIIIYIIIVEKYTGQKRSRNKKARKGNVSNI